MPGGVVGGMMMVLLAINASWRVCKAMVTDFIRARRQGCIYDNTQTAVDQVHMGKGRTVKPSISALPQRVCLRRGVRCHPPRAEGTAAWMPALLAVPALMV